MKNLKELLAKYDQPVPRYTSYPTVPVWTTSVTEDQYREALGSLKRSKKETLSLYFHIPFCERLCHYCGCITYITKDQRRSDPYVVCLLEELKRIKNQVGTDVKISRIHFGGGSPNFLRPEQIEGILKGVRELFEFELPPEISIEINPQTSSDEFCDSLGKIGFNRVSLGLQDLDPRVQSLLNRCQTFERTEQVLLLLRKGGIRSFNFDLVYGLPGQTTPGWGKTLEQVLSLRPDRLAIYSYAHVPWIKPYQRTFEEKDLPSPGKKIELFQEAHERLRQAGFRHIGMDHFTLPEDELFLASQSGRLYRNFMGYSARRSDHEIGIGMSAISCVAGNYFQNSKELPFYEKRIQGGCLATFRGYLLSKEDRIRREVIQKIMCQGSCSFSDLEREWGKEISALKLLEKEGLVFFSDNGFSVTDVGRFFLRNIAAVFDAYLDVLQEKSPLFSKAI